MEEILRGLERKAVVFDVGGFRPTDDLVASWFGRVLVGAPGEAWPLENGSPMQALCQINLSGLPFRPACLNDVELITIFISRKQLPVDEAPNGQGWCLRTYGSTAGLVPLQQPNIEALIRPFPMRPRLVEADLPCWEDVPFELAEQLEENYHDIYENAPGLKVGGWPTLIQSEIFWAPWNKHPAAPEFVLQVDSEPKAGWSWGDGGVGYFGRGTAPGKESEWAFTWQCL